MNTISLQLNSKGSATLFAVATVILMGILGSAVVQTTSLGYISNVNEVKGIQASSLQIAGLEDSKYKLDRGLDPTIEGKRVGLGTYSITTDPEAGTVTVTSQVGNARKEASFTAQFAKDCVAFDTSAVVKDGNELLHLKLVKTCNRQALLDQMTVNWDWESNACISHGQDNNGDHGRNHTGCETSSEALLNHGNAKITDVFIEQSTFYSSDLGAGGGEVIDGTDYPLSDNTSYEFAGAEHSIAFNHTHPLTAVYSVTATFADRSQIRTIFMPPNASN